MDDWVTIRAEICLLRTDAGGRSHPIRGIYRPNHNFFAPEQREMANGEIVVPEGEEFLPGECRDQTIRFLKFDALMDCLEPGRGWLIQEGSKVVGSGRILEVLSK